MCIIELGGTVGDLESAPFIEAMRQLRRRAGKDNFMQIHVSLVPVINGELKSKPTQAAIRDVRRLGLNPDLIACRCSKPLDENTISKISQYCDVDRDQVLAVTDVASLYHVPLLLRSQGILKPLGKFLGLEDIEKSPNLLEKGEKAWKAWETLTLNQDRLFESVKIVLVGKYTGHPDSYHSVVKSLEHASMSCSRKLDLVFVDCEHLQPETESKSPGDYHKAQGLLHVSRSSGFTPFSASLRKEPDYVLVVSEVEVQESG